MRFLTRRIVLIYFEEIKSKEMPSSFSFFSSKRGVKVRLYLWNHDWKFRGSRIVAARLRGWIDSARKRKEERRRKSEKKKKEKRELVHPFTETTDGPPEAFSSDLSFHLFQYTIRCHGEIVLIKIDRRFETLSTQRVAISFHICH